MTKRPVDHEAWNPDFDDPEDLKPEERLAEIVRILALGAIRLAEAESQPPPQRPLPRSQVHGFDPSLDYKF